jgi:hypothetical protein
MLPAIAAATNIKFSFVFMSHIPSNWGFNVMRRNIDTFNRAAARGINTPAQKNIPGF